MASLVYIARDIERALGAEPIGDYYIITNKTSYSVSIKNKYNENVYLIDKGEILDTFELLSLDEVQEIIKKLNADVLVFKNTIHIQQYCKEKNIKLLNPDANLSEKVENKITQVSWLSELSSLLPKHFISTVREIDENKLVENKVLIFQWSHGHTGNGTILISNINELNDLKKKFPYREVRVTEYIKGPMFTANIVVTDTVILLGNISYQITGMLPFTENAFSTIGNDWSVPHTILTENHIKSFESIAEKVGQKMQKENWRGLFGIDVIYDEERDELKLIEINARQPASTTYESQLQAKFKIHGIPGSTVFEAHVNALLKNGKVLPLIPINDGAQILQRVTKLTRKVDTSKLTNAGYKVIQYDEIKDNSDLVRIQSDKGIMEVHNKFNKRGKEIITLI